MITVILAIAVFFFLLGLVFRIFKPVDVLSGISAENITDRDGLGVWVGNSLMMFALVYAGLAGLLHLLNVDLSNASTPMVVFAGTFLFGQGLIVSYIMGTGKFTKTTARPPREIKTEEEIDV